MTGKNGIASNVVCPSCGEKVSYEDANISNNPNVFNYNGKPHYLCDECTDDLPF